MKKEQIEMRIAEIGTLVLNSQKEQSNYTGELASLHSELAMLNAPTLTEEQAVELNERLCDHIDSMDNTDSDNFDFEFEIDYDNRITVSHFDCTDLMEGIKNEFQEIISDFFKVEYEEEDE